MGLVKLSCTLGLTFRHRDEEFILRLAYNRKTITTTVLAVLAFSSALADPIDLNGTAAIVDITTEDTYGLRNGASITVTDGADIDQGVQPPVSLSSGISASNSNVVITGGSVTGGSNPFFVGAHGIVVADGSTGRVSGGHVEGGLGNAAGGDGVRVNPGGQLEVTGGEIQGGTANVQSFNGGNGVRVISGGFATLTGGEIIGGQTNSSGPGGAAVLVESSGHVVIDGANLTGGSARRGGDALRVIVGGSATIRSGEFSSGDFVPSPFTGPGRSISASQASIDIFGGSFFADITASNESEINIFGGDFLGRVIGLGSSPLNDGSIFNIRGGNFFDAIGGTTDTIINIFGSGLAFDGSRFTGFLEDGALFDVAFQPVGIDAMPTFNFFNMSEPGPTDPPISVAEPPSFWLLLPALLLVAAARKRNYRPLASRHLVNA